MKNQAFTLIELLVVVLVIGILVAVALPKYQIAVKKSEVAKVISQVRIIAEHQKLYKLSTGRFADTLEDLDISVTVPDGWYCRLYNSGSAVNQNNATECYNPTVNPTISVVYYYDEVPGNDIVFNKLYCWAKSSSAIDKRTCATFGPLLYEKWGGARYEIR